jgi:hypothetical protein
MPLPDWALNVPPLRPGDDFYLRAFWELSSCRAFGEIIGPIPWTAIQQYSEVQGLSPVISDLFHLVIRELDEAYLAWQRDEQRRRTESTRKKKS